MTVKTWVQDTFYGGLNDLLPENDIAENEVVGLINLVPGKDGEPLALRDGTNTVFEDSRGEAITSMFRFSRTTSSEGGSEFDLIGTDSGVFRWVTGGGLTAVHTWSSAGNDAGYATLLNHVFITNGVDQMVAWDGVSKVIVSDRGNALPFIPKRMMAFRGRLWGYDESRRHVVFSGVDDAEYEILPSTEPKTYYERWRVWGVKSEDETLPADGGWDTIGDDDGELITGIGYLFNGVVIFKESRIYLWSYSDDLHPNDVNGAVKEVLVPGVGCVSHDTICYQDGALIFLGCNKTGDYGIYSLRGQGIDNIAVKIPARLRRILSTENTSARGFIFGSTYYIAADDLQGGGSARTLVFAYDIQRKCWYEVQGWNVGAFSYHKENHRMLIGDGAATKVHEFPSGHDDNGEPIPFTIRTRRLDGNNPLHDWKWRNVWVDINSIGGEAYLATSFDGGAFIEQKSEFSAADVDYWEDDIRFKNDYWDDGTYWFDGSLDNRLNQALSRRANSLQLEIKGSSSTALSIRRIAVAFKPRKVRYA